MKKKTKSNLIIVLLTLTTILGFFTFGFGISRAKNSGSGFIVYVEPSGDITGAIDTNNLEVAFEQASAAGPGSSVILGEGIFYLEHTILVADFDGTFKGQGKGKTIIMNEHCDADPFPIVNVNNPTFFTFYLLNKGTDPAFPANIEIADLTMKAIGRTEEYQSGILMPMQNSFLAMISIQGIFGEYSYNAKISDIEIIGHYIEAIPTTVYGVVVDYVPNIVFGLDVRSSTIFSPEGYFSGEFIVSDCYVENAWQPFSFMGLRNSDIDIFDNSFVNTEEFALFGGIRFAWDCDIRVEISRNTFLNHWAFWLYNPSYVPFVIGGPYEPSTYLIQHNDINSPSDSYCAAIEAGDYVSGELKSHLIVSHNKIHNDNSYLYGPIFVSGFKDAVISNNIITGTGPIGMSLGLDGWTTGLKIIGNNLENFQVTEYSGRWGTLPEIARIWLGPGTSNCLVVGHTHDNVADDGMDNILVGVTTVQGPVIGQEIKDAMEMRKDLMKI
jgi:hypothetical protein